MRLSSRTRPRRRRKTPCSRQARAWALVHAPRRPGSAVLTWEPHTLQELDDVKGGLLCDEPGMGKTITVLSLVLKTRRRAPLGVDAGFSSSNALQQASSTRSAVAYPRQVKREHSSDEDQDADSCNHLSVHLQKKRFRIFLGPNPKTGASGPSFTWHPTPSTQSHTNIKQPPAAIAMLLQLQCCLSNSQHNTHTLQCYLLLFS